VADVTLCHLSEVPKTGEAVLREVAGFEIALVNVDGEFFALDNRCPHTGGPLADGEVNGAFLECPWHFAVFDVRTGSLVEGLASRPARTFPVRVVGEELVATVPDEDEG
jgi:nitrite reductase/ring-hydroxylating ferredoxin subunit